MFPHHSCILNHCAWFHSQRDRCRKKNPTIQVPPSLLSLFPSSQHHPRLIVSAPIAASMASIPTTSLPVILPITSPPVCSLRMYDCSNCLAVSRWCARGSRIRWCRWTEVVDYVLERVEGWRSGVARWLCHYGLYSGVSLVDGWGYWCLVIDWLLMMVGFSRRKWWWRCMLFGIVSMSCLF
jgi:hypothetical protein